MKKLFMRKYLKLTVLLICFFAQGFVLGAADKSESKSSSKTKNKKQIADALFAPNSERKLDKKQLYDLKRTILQAGAAAQSLDEKPVVVKNESGDIFCYHYQTKNGIGMVLEKGPKIAILTYSKKLSEQNKRQSEHFTQNEHTGDTCLPINQTGNDLNMKLTLPTEKFNAYSKKVNHDIEDRLKDESAQK